MVPAPPWPEEDQCEHEPKPRRISNVFITFPGGEFSRIEAEEPRVTKINIFKGNDPEKWVTEIPTFGRVRVGELAEGADLLLDTASPGPLWRFEGTENAIAAAPKPVFDTSAGVSESRSGDRSHSVRFDTAFGSFALALWEASSDSLLPWEASPDADRIVALGGVSVRLPNRLSACGQPPAQAGRQENAPTAQPPEPRVQDLLWGTYIGGSSAEYCYTLALDPSGNVVVGGRTASFDIPVPGGYDTSWNGDVDIYTAKLSADGASLLWGSYIGGSGGDRCYALALDPSGNVVVGGWTWSSDIPVPGGYDTTYNGGYVDLYVAKLTADGSSLLWGTYIGGSSYDECFAIALDSSGNVVMGGWTWSSDIPVPGGYDTSLNDYYEDIYVAKLSANGASLLWGSYLGGSDWEGCFALALDTSGNVVVGGWTWSSDIPVPGGYDTTHSGWSDIYVAKLSASGASLLWGTYIGGGGEDYCSALALDSSGNVVVGGGTESFDIPVPGGYDTSYNGGDAWRGDIYAAKLSASGASLLWGTYIGGSSSDGCYTLTLDGAGNVVVGGYTKSSDIPVPGGYDTTFNGGDDIYVAKLSANGASLLWGTYIGGGNYDYCFALALDAWGNVVAGGETGSSDIPVPGGYDTSYNWGGDIYTAKLANPPPVVSSIAKKGDPFRIIVLGGNLQNGIQVYINGVPWTNVKWKSTGKIVLKGGSSLKAAVPKNTPTEFRFVNPDGGEVTITWGW